MVFIKRKVIQIGESTQLISLPRSWAKKFDIKKGDELEVDESGNKLLIGTHKDITLNEVTIDVSNLDRTSILLYLRSAYRKGYDMIIINYTNTTTTHLRTGKDIKVNSIIAEEVRRLIGVEIINQKENQSVIKNILEHSGKEFDSILRRIFILLNEMCKDIVEGIKENNRGLLETMDERHDNITRFISYVLRLLNKHNYEDYQNIPSMYYLVANMEDLVDILKWIARDYLAFFSEKPSKEAIKIIEEIAKTVENYYDLFYKYEETKITGLYQQRQQIINNIYKPFKKFVPEELMLLNRMAQINEVLVMMTQTKMILEL